MQAQDPHALQKKCNNSLNRLVPGLLLSPLAGNVGLHDLLDGLLVEHVDEGLDLILLCHLVEHVGHHNVF